MSTLQDAIEYVQTLTLALSGMKKAPDYPPESVNVFPFAISFLGATRYFVQPAGDLQVMATIVTEIHVSRANLPVAVEKVMPYADSFPAAVWGHPTLNDTVTTVNEVRTGGVVPLGYAETKTLGFRFETDIKQHVKITMI